MNQLTKWDLFAYAAIICEGAIVVLALVASLLVIRDVFRGKDR